MIDPLLTSATPVTLVGGGEASAADIVAALDLAPTLAAADGGAALALAAGHMPAAVIGDMDSLAPAQAAALPADRLHRIDEQDSTDFEKALTRIAAPLILATGFLGGRVDHQLAALHVLMVHPDRAVILLGGTEIILLAPPRIALPTEPGDVVSLFPLAPVRAHSSGLHWPLDGLALAPGVQSGTSNRALGPMTLQCDAPGLLLILPRARLRPVAAALALPEAARWSARAG